MSNGSEAWLRLALQDLVDATVQEVEQPSDRLAGVIRQAKEALLITTTAGDVDRQVLRHLIKVGNAAVATFWEVYEDPAHVTPNECTKAMDVLAETLTALRMSEKQ